MQPSLRILRYVVAAADSGHVTEAARQLNVSQSAVSSAIAELETHVGVPLFTRRHARGVTLTPSGERVVNEARILLAHAREFARNASALGHSPTGEIALGCFQTLAIRFMPTLLAGFASRHPGISVTLQDGDQEDLLGTLLAGRIELALAYSFALPDEVEAEPIAELPPYAILSAGHPSAGAASLRLRDLAAEPFILLDLPHSRDYFASLFRAVGFEPRIVFRSRSQELIRGLVGRGLGFSILNAIPGTALAYDGGRIAVVPFEEALTPTRVMSLRLRRHAMRPAVRAFSDYLAEAFGPGGVFAPGSVTPPRIDPVQRLPA